MGQTGDKRDVVRASDAALHAWARAHDGAAIRELTRRHNQRLHRVAWSILKEPSDAEEAVQDAWLKAFTSPADFDAQSSFATWLTRIVINEALSRKRTTMRRSSLFEKRGVADIGDYRAQRADAPESFGSPEELAARAEFARRLERAVAQLPEAFRAVFVLRDIEGASIEETAGSLKITHETVKSRLHRARRKLQQILEPELHAALRDTFPFCGERCAALTERVLARLHLMQRGERQ